MLDFDSRDVGLSNSMARPMKLRWCVFNKVFLVNHWRDIVNCDIVNCGCVLVTLSGAYAQNHDFCLTTPHFTKPKGIPQTFKLGKPTQTNQFKL